MVENPHYFLWNLINWFTDISPIYTTQRFWFGSGETGMGTPKNVCLPRLHYKFFAVPNNHLVYWLLTQERMRFRPSKMADKESSEALLLYRLRNRANSINVNSEFDKDMKNSLATLIYLRKRKRKQELVMRLAAMLISSPPIGDFRVVFRLCFKASPSAKPFIWKTVLFTCKF